MILLADVSAFRYSNLAAVGYKPLPRITRVAPEGQLFAGLAFRHF